MHMEMSLPQGVKLRNNLTHIRTVIVRCELAALLLTIQQAACVFLCV